MTDALFRALHDRKLDKAVALVGLPFTTDDLCQKQRSPEAGVGIVTLNTTNDVRRQLGCWLWAPRVYDNTPLALEVERDLVTADDLKDTRPTLRPFAAMDDVRRADLVDRVASERLFSVSLPGGPLNGDVAYAGYGVAVGTHDGKPRIDMLFRDGPPAMMD